MKKLVGYFLGLTLLVILSNCNAKENKSVTENSIRDTIMSLPEVKVKNALIDSISNHKNGISLIIEKPTESEKDFYIQAGYNAEERFETYFHFYFNPQTKVISVMDIMDGKKISLEKWRTSYQSDSLYLEYGMNLLTNDSIGILKFDLSEKVFNKFLGKADSTSVPLKWETDGLFHQECYYKSKGVMLDICWEKPSEKRIFRITINAPCSLATARKIKIGSLRKDVFKAYEKEIDMKSFDFNSVIAGSVFAGMVFEFENDKVKSIFIGASAE